jgi:curved DNA-binding protein CbpA
LSKKLYKTLNISEDASQEDVKNAYRKKAKESHPDKASGSKEKMQEINKAYAILKNPNLRDRYDKTGDENAVDNEASKILSFAVEILNMIIQEDPKNVDKWMKDHKRLFENSFITTKNKLENEKEKLEKFILRIKKYPRKDFIKEILLAKLGDVDRKIKMLEEDHELKLGSWDMFSGYEWEVIKDVETQFYTVSMEGNGSKVLQDLRKSFNF